MSEKRLAELADVIYGNSPAGYRAIFSSIPMYGSGGIVGYATEPLFKTAGVIVPRKGSLGTPWFSAEPFWAIDTTYAAIPKSGVDAKWLFYQLLDFDLTKLNEATGVPSISRDWLLKQHFYTPDYEEQKGIAEVLSALDEQIEATEALVFKFDATRTGLVRDLLATVSDSPTKPLKELANVGSGITLGREFTGTGTAEYPYLRVANVQDGRLDLGDVKTIRIPIANAEKVMLQPGDVLMNEGGDFDKLGRGAVWEGQIPNCLHQNHVFRVRCDQSKLLPGFLSLWAASDFGKRFFILASKQSTNLASINSTQLKSFPVLAPSVEKQREILDAVEAIDAIQAQNKAEVSKLRLKKQGLMHDLLTGAVRVTKVN